MTKKFTTLIVEDDEISFELYKARLQKFDLNIMHANNGKVAIEKAIENPEIDLILMDIRMPVLDGYEATKRIREFNKNVHIIAQTAYAVIPEHRKILEMGLTDFFAKPLKQEQLHDIIERYKNRN